MLKTTVSLKPAEVKKDWVLIDAEGVVLGRLAVHHRQPPARQAQAAIHPACRLRRQRRRGERRQGAHHRQQGGPVGVLLPHRLSRAASRAARIRQRLDSKHPERVLEKAVERMITRGPLQRRQMKHLYVYAGAEHQHDGQQPRDARRRRAESEEQARLTADVRNPTRTLADLKDMLAAQQAAAAGRRRARALPTSRSASRSATQLGRSYATGRRKNAVARVWIKPGKGEITVNDKKVVQYFARPVLRMLITQPFLVADRYNQFDVFCTVVGGGPVRPGRRGAPRHLAAR